MSNALAEIRSWADKDRSERFELKRRRSGSSQAANVFNDLTGSQFPQQADPEQFQSMASYQHNQGEAYAAMRPTRQRVAGQPIHVAEVVSARDPDTGKRKGFSNPYKPGRREMQPEETAMLPVWVRQRFHLPEHQELSVRIKLHKSHHAEAARIEILESHPVLDLLSRPVPRLTQHTLLSTAVASLQMTGRCFWWITDSYDKGRPYDLWYLPTHWVREKPKNAYLDAGYLLTPPYNQVEGYPLPADRVIYFYDPDPANMFTSHSPTRAGVLAVQVDESIRLSQRQFFENSVLPWLAIITGDIIDPNGKNLGKAQLEKFQITQMMTRLNHMFQGASKHGRAIILDRAISDVKRISQSANEMDFMGSADHTLQTIWRNYGTPRVVAGDITDANRATALVADEAFLRGVVNPMITELSTTINDRLLPLFEKRDSGITMWIEEAKSSDKDGQREDMKLLLSYGAAYLDEARAAFGMSPLPNGKGKRLVNLATQILEPLDDEAATSLEDRLDHISDIAEATAVESTASRIESDSGKQKLLPGPIETKDFESSWLKLHSNNEKPFARDVEKLIKAQVASITAKMSQQTDAFDAAAVFNPRDWDAPLRKLAYPHLLRCGIAGAELARHKLKAFTKDDTDPTMRLPDSVVKRIKKTLDEALKKPYWAGINDTMLDDLANCLRISFEEGDTLKERVFRVDKALGGRAAGARSLMIARTESTLGLNAGQHEQIQEMIFEGIAEASEWLTTMDEHARQSHWNANGQKSDADGNFTVGGEKCKYPGDPDLSASQRVNCRCSLLSQ